MTSIATHRTPISILQETCVKKAITPVYELVSSEGPIHDPNYVFLCTAGPFSATSKGSSKKKAKHRASYLVLLKMFSSSTITEYEKAALRDLHLCAAEIMGSDFLDSLEIDVPEFALYRMHREEEANFVGQLQELCQRNTWPPPTYEFITFTHALSAGNKYHCKVKLWKWESEGHGASKKTAKRHAACNLFERIVSKNLTIPLEALESMEEENLAFLDKDEKPATREPKFGTDSESKVASKALRWLSDSKGNKIQPIPIDSSEQSGDPCQTLDDMMKQSKVSVVYTYINTTKSSSVYCLIQLSTTPPYVIKSVACTSMDEARRNAAARSILFLTSMSSASPQMDYDRWFDFQS